MYDVNGEYTFLSAETEKKKLFYSLSTGSLNVVSEKYDEQQSQVHFHLESQQDKLQN